jgi:hypothetical protein
MNAKNDGKQKKGDPFSDSKELFNKIFKEAIQEIELEKRGKKQSAASRIGASSGRQQHQTKMPAKKKSAAPPVESAQRKTETAQAGPESKPKRSEPTLPPKSTPKPDKIGERRSVAPMAAVLLVLVVILGGTVSSYMGIIDIFFLLNYFGSGREQTTQAQVPIRQPVKSSEKNVPSRIMGVIYVDSLKRPDGFSDEDLLVLLDIAQRVALAVETDRVALDLGKAAEGSVRDGEE